LLDLSSCFLAQPVGGRSSFIHVHKQPEMQVYVAIELALECTSRYVGVASGRYVCTRVAGAHWLNNTEMRDVSAFAPCQALHKLNFGETQVSDVSALASCHNLKTV
jgi:hypothetical protein